MPVTARPGSDAWALQLLSAVLLALLTIQGTSAQLDPTATAEPSGPIKLHLVAAYGPGLVRPATGPTLIARRLNQKRISCQLKSVAGVKARAPPGFTAQSVIAPTLAAQAAPAVLASAAVAAAAAPAARSACRGSLQSGRYNLLASYIEGATFPEWNCYPVAPSALADGSVSPAQSLPMETQVVSLAAGGSYTCVATYSKAAQRAVSAAAAIDWDAAVETAATAGASVARDACPTLSYSPPKRAAWAKPLAPLSVQGNRIMANGKPLAIKGINWFGFNVAMGMVDGLWAGGSDFSTDFGKITYELKLLGYNAVRLPFTHTNLANTKVWDLVRECKPLGAGEVKQRLIDPQDWSSNSYKAVPGNPAALGDTSKGLCNNYLPSLKNEDRLLFVLQHFINMNMYVILDYQPMGSENQAYDLNAFVSAWSALWQKVACLPNFDTDLAGRILVDVMNEPDSMGIRWEATGDRPGAQQLYLGTADALWAMTPGKVRFMFEGTGQNSFGLNWGNGFVTDPSIIQSRGLSNPTNFFRYLVKKQYVTYGASIITPHVYPPTITGATFLGTDLWDQCNKAFGYLQSTGFCDAGTCTQLPVLVGETGSAMTSATDVQWLNDFADYINAQGNAAGYTQVSLNGWLWWAFNENSGDTGGIVTNSWQDINWTKMRFMFQKLGLQPWYQLVSRRRRIDDEAGGVGAEPARTRPVLEVAVAPPAAAAAVEP